MRLIDAERMPNDEFFDGLSDIEKAKVIQWMISAPTVDAVEVVRCRDCKYIEMTEYGGYCCANDEGVAYDGYCAYGERSEDDE
jgi:hypothetical protein